MVMILLPPELAVPPGVFCPGWFPLPLAEEGFPPEQPARSPAANTRLRIRLSLFFIFIYNRPPFYFITAATAIHKRAAPAHNKQPLIFPVPKENSAACIYTKHQFCSAYNPFIVTFYTNIVL
jgi:hypothetical protein